jgi:cytochrome c-type biogenesis protein CcmH
LRPSGDRFVRPSAHLAVIFYVLAWLSAVTIGYALGQTSEEQVDRSTREIAQQLQCPICQGLSVADSPSKLAVDMRSVIRERVEAGQPRDDVIRYMTDRYGEEILMNPPRQGFMLAVWIAPYLGLAAAVAFLVWKVRGRRSGDAPVEEAALNPYLSEVDRSFERARDEPLR